jgi:hypothetical protein
MAGDYYIREEDSIPEQVIFVEAGQLEVISDGKCTRTLQRGDIIGKRWLIKASGEDEQSTESFHESINFQNFSKKTSLRAHTNTTLISGLSDVEDVKDLAERFETDFALLRMDRELVNKRRYRRHKFSSKKSRAKRRLSPSFIETSERDDDIASTSAPEKRSSVTFEIPLLEEKKTV